MIKTLLSDMCIQDAGNSGPLVALDVTWGRSGDLSTAVVAASKRPCAQGTNRRVAAVLDSRGTVKFTEFFWGTGAATPRTVSISIAAANASGVGR